MAAFEVPKKVVSTATATGTLKKANSAMQQHQKAGKQIAVKTN